MKSVTIAEFKRDLPKLLEDVARGDSVILQKGRSREKVAMLTPIPTEKKTKRPLGLLAHHGQPVFRNWEMTEEEFLEGR